MELCSEVASSKGGNKMDLPASVMCAGEDAAAEWRGRFPVAIGSRSGLEHTALDFSNCSPTSYHVRRRPQSVGATGEHMCGSGMPRTRARETLSFRARLHAQPVGPDWPRSGWINAGR